MGILTQCRMLVLAMLLGVSSFAGFVVLTVTGIVPVSTNTAPAFLQGNTAGIVVSIGAFAASLLGMVFERALDRSAKTQWEAACDKEAGKVAVARVLLTQTLIRAALVEGFALLGILSVMLSGDWSGIAAFVVAAAVLVMLSASQSRYDALLRRITDVDPFSGLGGPRT